MKNIYPFQCREDIQAEARVWVLKFNGDSLPTHADILAMREWSKRSPIHLIELKKAENFWAEADLLSRLAVPVSRDGIKERQGFYHQFFGLFRYRGGAVFSAVLILGVTIALSLWWSPMAGRVGNGQYQTTIGEQKILTLLDGSQIQLDTNSRVRVTYGEEMRQVYLLRGKAHFTVSENPDRPFEVYAGSGLVRAVGTAFSVDLAGYDVRVTVDEGRVELARVIENVQKISNEILSERSDLGSDLIERDHIPEVFLTLDRGQRASFDQVEEKVHNLKEKDLSREMAWRRGVLIFIDEPLRNVIKEVGRYTKTRIEMYDDELKDIQVGGRFRVGELDALFDILEAGFGVQVSYVNDEYIQLRFDDK